MVGCFAFGCKHVSSRNDCRMFRFPADEKEREKWVKLCRRADRELNRSFDRLCSCHFKDGFKQNGPSVFSYEPLVKIINTNGNTPVNTPSRRRRKICRYDSDTEETTTGADKYDGDDVKPFLVEPMIIELEGTPQKLAAPDDVTVDPDEHSLLGISGTQSPSVKSPTVNVLRPHPLLRAALANVESVPQFPEIVNSIQSATKGKKKQKQKQKPKRELKRRDAGRNATNSKLASNPASMTIPTNGGDQTFDDLRREAYAVAAENEIWRVLDDTPDYLTIGTLQAHQTFISVIVTAADLQAEIAVYGIPRHQKDSLLSRSLRDYLNGLAAMSVCPGIEDADMQPYALLPSNSTQNEFFRHIIYMRQGDRVTHSSRVLSNFCERFIETSESMCTQCELVYKLIISQ